MNSNVKIEDVIEKQGKVIMTPIGISMWPMLKHQQDQIVVEKITEPLKINDVVLFKRSNGKYVLHRIKKINENDYVIRGDNCTDDEIGILREQIIGVLKGFFKKKRYIDCEKNIGYKIYVLFVKMRHLLMK